MTILIVEDDPSAAALVQRILKRLGYKSDIAMDAGEAWPLIEDGRYRIVISDWMMPGEDGLALCRRIRSSSLPFYVYVMILTGRSQRGDLLEALSAGADDFLVKPVDPDELRVRLLVADRIVRLEGRLRAANAALQEYARDLDERAKLDELMQIGNRAAQGTVPFTALRIDPERHPGRLLGDQRRPLDRRQLLGVRPSYPSSGHRPDGLPARRHRQGRNHAPRRLRR